MQTPKTKPEFYERWERGEFGNKIVSFPSWHDFLCRAYSWEDIKKVKISIRYKEAGSPYHVDGVEIYDVGTCLHEFQRMGADPNKFTFNETAPDDHLTMQGEMVRLDTWYLDYSLVKKAMRPALREARQRAKGRAALAILRQYTNDNSYQMIMDLFDKYDTGTDVLQGTIVEFSCYDIYLGNMPGHNTIIWEVRDY